MRLTSILATTGTKLLEKVVVRLPKWNAIEVFLLLAAFAGGVAGLFAREDSSRIIREQMPNWIIIVWYTLITISSVIALYGIYKNRFDIGSGAYFVLGPVGFIFGIVVLSYGGSPLALSGILTTSFGLAGIVRGIQLFGLLKDIERRLDSEHG